MDRQIVYNGQVPLETDILNTNKNVLSALGWLAQGVLGTGTLATDITCIPTGPPSLNVQVTAGQIFSLKAVDTGAYSSLPSDSHQILKQGLLLDTAVLGITPPGTIGFSQNYLIQAAYTDTDAGSTTLPYYNPTNPTTAWSGPTGSGTPQFTVRKGVMTVGAKAGVAATSGSQVTPAPDAGFVGLFVVTVANGAASISSGNITQLANAPMLATNGQLPLIPSGVLQQSWVSAQDTGSANALVVTLAPPPAAYTARMALEVRAAATCTGAATINVNGLGNKAIVRPNQQALQGGDILINALVRLVYDGTNFQLVSFNGSTLPRTQKQVFTASGTFTATVAGPHKFSVWGGGGGGGGAGGSLAGSAGSGGCYAEITKVLAIGDTVAVVIGAGGTAGTNGGTNGGAGGNSSVTIAATTYTAGGGPGGLSNTTAGTSTNSPGVGTTSGAWDRTIIGQQGGPGYLMTSPGAAGGQGGSAPLGGLGGVGGGGIPGNGSTPGGGAGGGANNPAQTGTGARGEAWVEF